VAYEGGDISQSRGGIFCGVIYEGGEISQSRSGIFCGVTDEGLLRRYQQKQEYQVEVSISFSIILSRNVNF
jgi:hypothetical protein